MKIMNFKLNAGGSYTYCLKPTGDDFLNLEITNIPDDIKVEDVLPLLHKTAMWMVKSVEYSQLGEGVLIKRNTLTPTEQRITDLINQEGLTNRKIAERLGIAEGTIRTHMSRILIKLNIKSRNELKDL